MSVWAQVRDPEAARSSGRLMTTWRITLFSRKNPESLSERVHIRWPRILHCCCAHQQLVCSEMNRPNRLTFHCKLIQVRYVDKTEITD